MTKPSDRVNQLRGGTVTHAEAICAYLDEQALDRPSPPSLADDECEDCGETETRCVCDEPAHPAPASLLESVLGPLEEEEPVPGVDLPPGLFASVASGEDDVVAEWLDSNDGRLFVGASPAPTSSPSEDNAQARADVARWALCRHDILASDCSECGKHGTAASWKRTADSAMARNARLAAERDTLRARVEGSQETAALLGEQLGRACNSAALAGARIAQLEAETSKEQKAHEATARDAVLFREQRDELRRELDSVIASRGIVAENERVRAVVEAARSVVRSADMNRFTPALFTISALQNALSALDQQPESAKREAVVRAACELEANAAAAIAEKAVAWVAANEKQNDPTPLSVRAAAAMAADRLLGELHRMAVDFEYDRSHGTFPPSAPELPDSSAQAPREIKVGSKWRFQGDPEAVDTVVALENTTHVKIRLGNGAVLSQNKEKFREEHTWLSDPPETEELKL